MTTSVHKRIESFKTEDFVRVLVEIGLSENDKAMLRLHYSMPSHRATARQLSHAMGWKGHNPWNGHFGSLASRAWEAFRIPDNGEDKVMLFTTFSRPPGSESLLELRPPVIGAIEKLGLVQESFAAIEELSPLDPLTEGSARLVQVNSYERNPEARRKCIEHHGDSCSICGSSFAKTYGEPGKGIIHVHHLKALSRIGREYTIDPVKDLIPVCPNCHAMIHSRNKMYTPDEVKHMIADAREEKSARRSNR